LALALVRDLREHRMPVSAEEFAGFETDVLAGFVLARASTGLADSTIRNDTGAPRTDPGLVRPAAVGDATLRRGYLLPQGAARGEAVDAHRRQAAALTVYFQFLPVTAAQDRSAQPDRPRDRVPAG
jgi:integrase/recombinase XerD